MIKKWAKKIDPRKAEDYNGDSTNIEMLTIEEVRNFADYFWLFLCAADIFHGIHNLAIVPDFEMHMGTG